MKTLSLLLLIPLAAFGQIVMNNQVACIAPSISTGPVSQTDITNTSLTVTVTAAGTSPLAYQWTLGASPVSGATTSSYATNSATAATNSYYVIVTNACGSITSSAAVLTWTNGTGGGWTDNYYPTNIVGHPAYTYWVADNVTLSIVTNWPDYSGNGLNLTNVGVTSEYTKSNSWLNGHAIVHTKQGGSSLPLSCNLYTNFPPFEMIGVFNIVAVAATNQVKLSESINFSTAQFSWGRSNQEKDTSTSTGIGGKSGGFYETNKWIMLDIMSSTTSGGFWTNNVADSTYGTGQNATTGAGGIEIHPFSANPCFVDYAEFVIYSNSLDATIRENLWEYYTNKYNISR